MKCIVSTACVLSVLIAVSFAAPYFPAQFSASTNLQLGGSSASASGTATASSSTSGGSLQEVLSSIDIPALLRSVNSIVKLVGVFCPPLSQVLDNVIQNVTSVAFRVFGRAILRNGLGGGGSGGSSSSGGGSRVNVVLPTYPPDEDEDYDEDDETTKPGSADNVDLRIAQSTTATNSASPASDDENTVAKRHVRVIREAKAEEQEEEEEEEGDQDGAESAPQPSEDLSNADADDADRNKRYSPFGGSVSGHGGAGSGNFLFDIIRNTADRAARTVGTVYRMVAGTENLGWGLTNAKTAQTITSYAASSAKLIAGSGATEESDEKINGPGGVAELDIAKGVEGGHHHDGEGIPGPITRLFVVANRGLANLVQDLILRLAQTSEKLVNFKARLVTSLI